MTDPEKPIKNDMPPVPRDYNQASQSELIPFKSQSIRLFKSPLFYMVMLTALVSTAFFGYLTAFVNKGSVDALNYLFYGTMLYLLGMVLLIVYLYSRSDRPFWHFLVNSVFVAFILYTPLENIYFFIFRDVLPGNMKLVKSHNFVASFIGSFFGAGLCEELIKGTLVLIGAYLVLNAGRWSERVPQWLYKVVQIRNPLDGMLMGIFGGAGFIVIETGFEYVPNAVHKIAQHGGIAKGLLVGILLLMPRVMSGMVGHMAYAGIFGYFIGLAVIRRGATVKYILIGWLVAAVLHGAWDGASFSGSVAFVRYALAFITGAFVIAFLLKARQLNMAMGGGVDTYGSIVVEPGSRPAPKAAAAPPVPAQPTGANAAGPGLGLAFQGTIFPIEADKVLDLGKHVGIDASILGEVTRHPTRHDVLGLKNLSERPWTAHLRDGTEQTVDFQRNLRLAPGVRIDFGGGLVAEVVSR